MGVPPVLIRTGHAENGGAMKEKQAVGGEMGEEGRGMVIPFNPYLL